MARGKKKEELSLEEKLEQALVPVEEQPYEVPGNWCWTRWGKIGEFVAGNGFKKEYQGFIGYEIPFYKVGSLKYADDFGYLYDESNTITEEIRMKLKATLIPRNSILFAKIGEAIRLNRRCLNRKECCIDNNTMAFITHSCNFRYVYYWTLGQEFYDLTNATTVPAIRKSDLELIKIPLPPLAEQQRIVERIESLFAKLDEAKDKVQEVVCLSETRHLTLVAHAFTGELIGIKDVCTIPLLDIVEEIKIGPFGSLLHKEDYIDNGIPVINPKHINNQEIILDKKITITSEKAKELSAYVLKENDIIMGRRGEMGRTAPVLLKEKGYICGTGSLIIRLKKGFRADFYSQILASQSVVSHLEQNCVGSTLKNLNEKIVKQIPVPYFTKDQQDKLMLKLESMLADEKQILERIEKIINTIDLMKKSILAKAFRGEFGTNNPDEESAIELLKTYLVET